jgi:peptide/nickel transport system substrate-binding protein
VGGGSAFHPSGVTIETTTRAPRTSLARVTWDEPYGEPTSLDPLKARGLSENTVLANTCDALQRTGPDLSLQPGLATSWTHPTPTTTVFKIRAGVRFWDGAPMTVGDVVYSLRRHLDPRLGTRYRAWVNDIQSIAQTGPDKITLTTKIPDVLVAQMMSTGLGTVIEQRYAEARGSAYGSPAGGLMCTGPFELSSWTRGRQIVLRRNPAYWDEALEPRVQTLVFKFITDPTKLIEALTAGRIDGTYEVPIAGIPRLASLGSIYAGLSTSQEILQPLQSTGLDANWRIRKALSFGIERTSIIQSVLHEVAVPELFPIPPDSFAYATQRFRTWWLAADTPVPRHGGPARTFVVEAGEPKATMTIGIEQGDLQSLAVAQAVRGAAAEIGLKMAVARLPRARYEALMFSKAARRGIDWTIGRAAYLDQAEPLQAFFYWGLSNSSYNFDGFKDPHADSLFAEARAQADPQLRAPLAIRALQRWVRTVNNIPLYISPELLFMNNTITGAPTSLPTFLYYPWAAMLGGA